LYILLLLYVFRGWNNTNEGDITANASLKFSIIIPVKNEEKNIVACIESIFMNSYPNDAYEILVVDDHSTDDTVIKMEAFNNKNLCLHSMDDKTGKKNALTYGIQMASFDTIIALDGDCFVQTQWLASVASAFEHKNADVVVGPVKIIDESRLIARYEFLDTAAMMVITANGILRDHYYLANGANLAFKKEAFLSLEGYSGNEHIASGDDVFFVNKAAKAKMRQRF
jgi:poly-beta-1,6-N-acetyl-D-glucosamine synthase